MARECPIPQQRIYAFIFLKHGGETCRKIFVRNAYEYYVICILLLYFIILFK
jgi:hypothetical protein